MTGNTADRLQGGAGKPLEYDARPEWLDTEVS
jgi:hypothetical protein